MMTVIADGVRNVEGEVVAALGSGYPEQLSVLLFAQMFFQIHVQCRASGQMLDVAATVQAEFVHNVQRAIFHNVEVAVVAVAEIGRAHV